jgi:peptidoglycan hydrolase-like protein with peptidoglycan-binding domain
VISELRRPHMDVPQHTMTYGRKGQDVADLQILLRDAGVYPHDLDGYYGNYTRNAVYELSVRLFTPATGHYDEPLIAALNDLLDHEGCVDSAALCESKLS